MPKRNVEELRGKVAREAATLLYFGLEKEYRQAKLKAAQSLSTRTLPSNLEIALELDHIAEQTEGPARMQRLIQMRTDALQIMQALRCFNPVLIGSVWRGTIRKGSDIDIEVFSDSPSEVTNVLGDSLLKVARTQQVTVNEQGKTQTSLHIYGASAGGFAVELVVRSSEEAGKKRTCDTFRDLIDGLTVAELEKVLRADAAARFLPT